MAAYLPNTIRDATTGAMMTINADGSFNASETGVRSIAAGSVATLLDVGPGIIRDPVSGVTMVVNADGSINIAIA